ncbi:MAG TPA: ABC transporter ATP-binding protein, partial [Burkholderiales bacterium]
TALGATSIVVSYDVSEAVKLADHIYLLGDGVVAAQGMPEELAASRDPFVRQFMDAKPDGPIPFNVPAAPFAQQIGLAS